jgi:hypothetical protein
MSAECDQLPESKSAIMTLWSSQAEQMSRLLDHTTDRKVLQPAMLMLSQLKWLRDRARTPDMSLPFYPEGPEGDE